MEPGTSSAFNEEPYIELENDNYQGQRDAGTLNKYAQFSTWKTNVYISLLIRKVVPFSLK